MALPSFRSLATLGVLLVFPALASGQTTADPARVVTSGTAQRSLRPDRAIVRLGIEVHAPTAAEASAALTTRLRSVLDTLKHFPSPLDSVQTVSFSVGPNYDYDDGKKLIDYEASATIQLSLRSLDRLGALVDGAIAAGATDIPGMTFESDSSAAVRRVLLAEALADARKDAMALATAGGAKLGPMLHLSTMPPAGTLPGMGDITVAYASASNFQGAMNGALGPRDVVVRVSVYTTWLLRTRAG